MKVIDCLQAIISYSINLNTLCSIECEWERHNLWVISCIARLLNINNAMCWKEIGSGDHRTNHVNKFLLGSYRTVHCYVHCKRCITQNLADGWKWKKSYMHTHLVGEWSCTWPCYGLMCTMLELLTLSILLLGYLLE